MNADNASDVVIVGGGIYGASLAYELSLAGKSVTLLEGNEIASGASGGPGERGVRANARDIRELPIVALAQQRWAHYQQKIDGGVGYRRNGGICVVSKGYGAREHEIMGMINARLMMQNAMGSPSEFLSRDAALAREPELSPSILGVIYSPNDGVGDHTFATRQFAKEAQKLGAVVRTGAKVVEVLSNGKDATGVKLESGEIVPVKGQLAMMCNTGVLPLLKNHFGADEYQPIYHLMPQMMYVTNPDGKKVNHLLGHMQRPLAIKQLPDGTIMLSGGVSVAYDRDGRTSGELSALSINLTDAIQTMPFLDRSTFIKADSTRTDTVAVDGIPIISRPEKLGNTIYGHAWTGHGFAISLGFTKYFTDWLISGNKPAELDPFSPRRFSDPARASMAALSAQKAAFSG